MLAPLLLTVLLSAAPALAASKYVPQKSTCPSETLVRAASGLSDDEETYRVSRKAVADVALKSWLASTNSGFGTSGELPTVPLFHVLAMNQSADTERLRLLLVEEDTDLCYRERVLFKLSIVETAT
jgi:hypothetical protein